MRLIQTGDAVVVDKCFRAEVTLTSHYSDMQIPVYQLRFADGRNTGGRWYFPHQIELVPDMVLLAEVAKPPVKRGVAKWKKRQSSP